MADIFEQMKQGAELILLMDTVAECGVPFTLTHTGDILGEWQWESMDGVFKARGPSALEVMRTAFGLIGRERDGYYERLKAGPRHA